MPQFPIDSTRATLVATGKVTPVNEWTTDGKRTDNQKRNPDTGMPLWIIDCLVDDDDAARSAVAGVEVGSPVQPVVQKFRPVAFVGLTLNVYVQRQSGALVCRWSAEEIADAPARNASAAS